MGGSSPGTLYVVGTPIGNLGDLTERARGTLAVVGVVVAEDTRRTRALLSHLGVRARLLSLPAERERERAGVVLARLRAGDDVALVTDAGMPGISDPGAHLVAAALEAGIPVAAVPGPSAALAALVVSGLRADRFAFEGFLPRGGAGRAERLVALAAEPRTVVLFESPRRTAATLRDLLAALGGERRAAVCRELTKLHEEVLRGTLAELVQELDQRELRGEVTIVVEGGVATAAVTVEVAAGEAVALVAGGMRPRAAASEAARRHGLHANAVYAALLALRRPNGTG
ncbi:MAG TPA: 16S rRNA (cytidine(1402)-2'-O)-methyltransferase [Actinomycetota bacterium]|nr:16S rRNA (cytidine(1402)-2'-O)-methyltransferase [Actinomycetota bacterium]